MEEKKPKGNLLGWIGVCLGALALFLVVFGPGLKEGFEKWKAEQAVKAELKQQEIALKERTEEKEERADWTYEDYAAYIRQMVIDGCNNSDMGDFDYAISSEAELASLKFDRICVTGDPWCKEANSDHDLVIWYRWQPDYEEKSWFQPGDYDGVVVSGLWYDIDNSFHYNRYEIETVGDFVDYWIENQEHLIPKGPFGIVGDAVESYTERRTKDCYTLFTAEDFEAFYGGEAVEDT